MCRVVVAAGVVIRMLASIGRASGVKMVAVAEVGTPISQDGRQSIRIVRASAFVIFILLRKMQEMANKDTTFGYHPVGAPKCLHKQEVGNPSWNAAQPCARAELCY